MIEKIITGGQTGVDQAGLDAAIGLNVQYGGWCPKGRINEAGLISAKFKNLVEVDTDVQSEQHNYDTRTCLNIRDSDGTLILVPSLPLPKNVQDGTIVTISEVNTLKKPYLIINLMLAKKNNIKETTQWLNLNNVKILNIAGPRETSSPGIYNLSFDFLKSLIQSLECGFASNLNLSM